MAQLRNVKGGTEKYTQIICGKMHKKYHACHSYEIWTYGGGRAAAQVADIQFQEGPIKEVGNIGCSNEDLLAIVADRLECFQKGKFPCVHNAKALACVHAALLHLNDRTMDREKRGVEGQHKA